MHLGNHARDTAGGRTSKRSRAVRLDTVAGGRDLDLVLGLDWHTILGTDLRRQAMQRARTERASHFVHAGGRSESVGTVQLATGRARGRREAHAAAQIFATQAGAGAHALVWRLDDGTYWIAQVRDGRVLAGGDVVVDEANAAHVLQAFQARFGDEARIQGDTTDPVVSAPTLALLAGGCGPGSLLQARAGSARMTVVAPLALVAAAIGWQVLGPHWTAAPPMAIPDDDQAPASDPALEARLALQAAVSSLSAPTLQGVASAWGALGALPLRPAGWRLYAGYCTYVGGTQWSCEAEYGRGEARATAAGLHAHGLPGSLRWRGLDQATVQFQIEAASTRLALDDLQTGLPGVIADADRLLRMRAAFTQLHVGEAVAVAVPASASGTAPGVAPALPVLQRRDVRLRGPMRSVTLLEDSLTRRIVWHRLHMSFEPGTQPGLDASAIVADLQGTSYEIAS